jgi:hypothetical protein
MKALAGDMGLKFAKNFETDIDTARCGFGSTFF